MSQGPHHISRQEDIKNNERSKRIIRVNQFARFGQPHGMHVLPCFAHTSNFRVRPLPMSHYCCDVFSEYCTFITRRSENVIIFVWFEQWTKEEGLKRV
jgi:hypothetical protein